MATALNAEDIGDIITATLDKPMKMTWTDISLPLTEYLFSTAFMRGRQAILGGPRLVWDVQTRNTGSARVSGMYDVDNTTVKDLLVQAKVEWAKITVNYTYDIDEEMFNSGPTQIVNHIKVRAHSMWNDYFELMEELMWSNPSSSVSPNEPLGIPHWIVKGSADAFDSYGGGNPSGHTAGAGNISSSTYPRWDNATARYTVVSPEDCLAKLWEAFIKTGFKAPDPYPEQGGGRPQWGLFSTFPFIETYTTLLTYSNESVGSDMARFKSPAPLFMGIPVERVPALDDSTHPAYDSANPIYGINFKTFRWIFQQGKDRRMSKPIQVGNAHTVFQVHLDSWGNFQCTNRRANFVIHQN